MRILIIDQSKEFMSWLRLMLAAERKDIEISEYDPDQRGRPPTTFDWSLYDLLILGHELDEFDSGLDWLDHFRAAHGLPPVLYLANNSDAYVAASAIKLGAGEFLVKRDITPERLVAAIHETLRQSKESDDLTELGLDSGQPSGGDSLELATSPDEYLFTRLIGQGAMSRVYLAKRLADGQLVVVKTIKSELLTEPRIRRRFIQEAEIARSVPSAHLVETFDYHVNANYGIISMEFLPGGDLKQRKERGLSPAQAIDYTRQIASGVHDLWNAHIVHRDLKPGNIMFRASDQVVISDFGIAKRLNEGHELTVEGKVLGTPAYMSPEQFLGKELDTRSDLYSLGVMLYEMLLGKRPFTTKSIQSLMYQHVHIKPPLLPAILSPLQPVIDRLLAKDPRDRFENGPALASALDGISVPVNDDGDRMEDTFTTIAKLGS